MPVGARSVLLTVAFVMCSSGAEAQRGELREAFELERRGRHEAAARLYLAALTEQPTHLSALLGLERVLQQLDRLDSIVPYVASAIALQPSNRSIRALELRVWAMVGEPESLTVAAGRWIERAPDSPEPYREWAMALVQSGDTVSGQQVLADGAKRLGNATLAQDMAELSVDAGDWYEAVRQWGSAVQWNPSLLSAAAGSLSRAPSELRQQIVGILVAEYDVAIGGRLAAELLVGWDRPLEGWTVLDRSLPGDRQVAVSVLRRFADRARSARPPDGARAQAYALERVGELAAGPASERAYIDAARAFAEAGDRRAAERMLQRVSGRSQTGERAATDAMAALIGVMAKSGKVEEAEGQFHQWKDRLSADDVAMLREAIARAWITDDNLDRAEAMLADDSTVSTFATRGWIALFRGDLTSAGESFRRAGPRAGSVEDATERVTVLALLQRIEPESAPELGRALHLLAQGDSAEAVSRLQRAANGLPRQGGRPDVLAFAGRVAVERGDARRAETILVDALEVDSAGVAAPVAKFELARAYIQLGRHEAARDRLEGLILSHSESAIVPRARRLLDQVRGDVPRS
jgi:FimV-like protein